MSDVLEELMHNIKDRKLKAENGISSCIPFAFKHVRNIISGINPGDYILITGSTKAGKTQITNYLVIYNTIMYAYTHQDEMDVEFNIFPLEEEPQTITARFLSHCVYLKFKKIIQYNKMMSSNIDNPLSDEELKLLEDDGIQQILKFFVSKINFHHENSSVGISKTIHEYAKKNGKIVTKTVEIDGSNVDVFDYYIPNNPEKYVINIIDHVGLLQPNNKEKDLNSCISNLSKDLVKYKNRYKHIMIVVQQQVDSETTSLDAVKNGNVLATKAGLKDCKSTGNDCTQLWGISNPGMHSIINEWGLPGMRCKYDLNKFKRKYFRVFEVILNRFGEGNILIPLRFHGSVNCYSVLPSADKIDELEEIYKDIENESFKQHKIKPSIMFLFSKN